MRYLDEMLAGRIVYTPRQLSELLDEFSKTRKVTRNRKIAIRNYLNFLVKKGYYRKSQVIDYFPILETEATGVRKTPFPTDDKIVSAHRFLLDRVRENPEKYEKRLLAFELQVFGGVRLTEAVDILNNFNEKYLTYFDKFARYDLLEMYKDIGSTKAKADKTKRAWVCYMPVWLAKKLKKIEFSDSTLRGEAYTNGIVTPIGVREWFSDFLKRLKVEERVIEFMTGKTPAKILRRHYFDLLREADEVYPTILDKFPIREVEHADRTA